MRGSVSVVVPTFNRATWLGDALDSLASQQTDDVFEYEIIVVDNASTDDTPAVVAAAAERSKVSIRYEHEKVQGDGAARNRGIGCASHELIAFFDDDQIADSHWLGGLLNVVQSSGATIVGGPVELLLDERDRDRFGLVTRRDMLRESIPYDEVRPYEPPTLPGTCNLLVAREVFDAIGLFDAEMNGGSDFDFLDRALKNGYTPWYTPNARVRHRVGNYRKTKEYFRREARRNGWMLAEGTNSDRGALALAIACVARIGQAGIVNAPMLGISLLRGYEADASDRRVLLWRAEGFVRRTVDRFIPWIWRQSSFIEGHQFAGYESQQLDREDEQIADI